MLKIICLILFLCTISMASWVSTGGGGAGGVDTTSIARDGTRVPNANQDWNFFNLFNVSSLEIDNGTDRAHTISNAVGDRLSINPADAKNDEIIVHIRDITSPLGAASKNTLLRISAANNLARLDLGIIPTFSTAGVVSGRSELVLMSNNQAAVNFSIDQEAQFWDEIFYVTDNTHEFGRQSGSGLKRPSNALIGTGVYVGTDTNETGTLYMGDQGKYLQGDNLGNMLFSTTTMLGWLGDNNSDIGSAAGAGVTKRPRSIYAGTSLSAGDDTPETGTLYLGGAGKYLQGDSSGNFVFSITTPVGWAVDNDSDIGSAAGAGVAKRPRSVYAGTSIVSPLVTVDDGANQAHTLDNAQGDDVLAVNPPLSDDDLNVQLRYFASPGASAADTKLKLQSATTTDFLEMGFDKTTPTVSFVNGQSSLELQSAGSTAIEIDSTQDTTLSGDLAFDIDNAYDIGTPDGGATQERPRDLYVANSIVFGDERVLVEGAVSTTTAAVAVSKSFTLDDNSVYLVRCVTVARRTDAAGRAMYRREALVYREGGAATLQGTVDTIGADKESNAAWDADITVSSNDAECEVTGAADQDLNWQTNLTYIKVD